MQSIGYFSLSIPRVWGNMLCGKARDDVWCCNQQDWKLRGSLVMELALRFPSTEPMEAHFHGFGAFGDDSVVCAPNKGKVFSLDG